MLNYLPGPAGNRMMATDPAPQLADYLTLAPGSPVRFCWRTYSYAAATPDLPQMLNPRGFHDRVVAMCRRGRS